MKGQSLFRTIGCAFFLSAVLLSLCSCSQPCHPSDYDNSLVSCQAGSGKVIFHYRNLTTNRSSTAEVREKDVSASSQVMPVSSFGDYFLVYGRQDTLIADGKQLAVYPLHHARCSAIGEDNSEIYCYAYEDSRTSLLAYDKKKHTSAPIAVLADTPDLIENKGMVGKPEAVFLLYVCRFLRDLDCRCIAGWSIFQTAAFPAKDE